ncbi:hypothetical protein [Pseudomonas nunensis]|uniref:hypothetical protein n=1 Tax=Pseudomonas nunensis TaxID=2961896 RepID=UPI0025B2805C|nr:hypothetical protein [Pseudomonas nunensis]MDN3224172.1 hypothetical protein [Pseudomonas nunensis]
MKRALLLLPLFLSLTGCEKIADVLGVNKANTIPSSSAAPVQAAALNDTYAYKFEINTQSPDQALKTWWRYLDARASANFSRCQFYIKQHANDFDVSTVSTGDVEEALKSRVQGCAITVYSREITEVKQETETRAIASVKIINSTPSSASHTVEDEKRRSKGEQYKYLIEKSSSGWKVSQVYKYGDSNKLIGKDDWAKEYTPSVESYQVYVFGDQ